jgi:hypothetical protein
MTLAQLLKEDPNGAEKYLQSLSASRMALRTVEYGRVNRFASVAVQRVFLKVRELESARRALQACKLGAGPVGALETVIENMVAIAAVSLMEAVLLPVVDRMEVANQLASARKKVGDAVDPNGKWNRPLEPGKVPEVRYSFGKGKGGDAAALSIASAGGRELSIARALARSDSEKLAQGFETARHSLMNDYEQKKSEWEKDRRELEKSLEKEVPSDSTFRGHLALVRNSGFYESESFLKARKERVAGENAKLDEKYLKKTAPYREKAFQEAESSFSWEKEAQAALTGSDRKALFGMLQKLGSMPSSVVESYRKQYYYLAVLEKLLESSPGYSEPYRQELLQQVRDKKAELPTEEALFVRTLPRKP